MNYALILAGVVANKVTSILPLASVQGYDAVVPIAPLQKVEIGYLWDGLAFAPGATPPEVNRALIEAEALNKLAGFRTYIGLATPTAAQRIAFEREVARTLIGLIRIQLGQLDGTA